MKETWLGHATTLKKSRDWQGLLDWCLKWTKSEPQKAEAWFGLGTAYDSQNRCEEAGEAYQQAMRINPKRPSGDWFATGTDYFNEFMSNSYTVEATPKDDARAWHSLGVVYGNLKYYDEAIGAFRQVLRIKPAHAIAWYNLGSAFGKLKRYNDAIDAYRQALRIDPKYSKAWYNLGVSYAHSGDRAATLDAAKKLRYFDPKRADMLLELILR